MDSKPLTWILRLRGDTLQIVGGPYPLEPNDDEVTRGLEAILEQDGLVAEEQLFFLDRDQTGEIEVTEMDPEWVDEVYGAVVVEAV